MAEVEHFYKPGKDITCHANVAITGGRCVMIVGNRPSGPALNTSAEGGNYLVGLPTAAGRIFGVALTDAASGAKVGVTRGGVVPIESAGNIAAGAEVEVNGSGQVITKSAGVAIGFACTGSSSGAYTEVALYNG
jgi:predicted RecA/RadA family phage recombinase